MESCFVFVMDTVSDWGEWVVVERRGGCEGNQSKQRKEKRLLTSKVFIYHNI